MNLQNLVDPDNVQRKTTGESPATCAILQQLTEEPDNGKGKYNSKFLADIAQARTKLYDQPPTGGLPWYAIDYDEKVFFVDSAISDETEQNLIGTSFQAFLANFWRYFDSQSTLLNQ